jgi:phospholipid-translocating ATPase
VKKISPQEWKTWQPKYDAATKAMQNRDERMQEVQAELEQNLEIIGATAIEDKL